MTALPVGAVPFRWPARTLGAMAGPEAGNMVTAAADVALVLDRDGVVEDVSFGDARMASAGLGDLQSRAWADTVTVESRGKVAEMLSVARAPRWRQINQIGTKGEVPVRYLALGLGSTGRTLLVGRDLRGEAALQQRLLGMQQAMERDYTRLRQTETRYRALFDLSDEAVFIVETARRRILEANPAALRLAGEAELVGQAFTSLIHAEDRESAIALLGAIAAAEQAVPAIVHMGEGAAEYAMTATLFRQDRSTHFLVRVAATAPLPDVDDPGHLLADIVRRVPDAFVVTDDQLQILVVNAAFLDLTEIARPGDVVGEPLGRFVGRPGIDLSVMVAQLREHGVLRNFPTIARARGGHEEEVEIAAVAVPDAARPCLGFAIRGVSRRVIEAAPSKNELPRSVEQLTELVGRISLKEIVRESTDLIERLCIEAALSYTGDNRASAAEILGLSRQSLYSKLHRHGLGNLIGEAN